MAARARRALLSSLLLCAPLCRAAFKNFTIDDTTGDERTGAVPIYSGPNAWRARTTKDDCSDCKLQPNPDDLHARTWHDNSVFVNQDPGQISFGFVGTDVYIFCVLSGPVNNTATHTLLSMVLDGAIVDKFQWAPLDDSPAFTYNQLVLSANGLENKHHDVVILNDDTVIGNVVFASVILFDYVLYTADDAPLTTSGSTTTSSPGSTGTPPQQGQGGGTNVGLYAGLGAGLGVLAIALAAIVFLLLRRRRRSAAAPVTAAAPWVQPVSGPGPRFDLDPFEHVSTVGGTGRRTPSSPFSAPQQHSPASGGVVAPYLSETSRTTATSLSLGSPLIQPLSDHKRELRAAADSAQHDDMRSVTSRPPRYTMEPGPSVSSHY